MATSMQDAGSGRFVPVREWTCSQHDSPDYHDCDCECCGYEECAECKTSKYVDVFDADGQPVMRELDVFEAFILDSLRADAEKALGKTWFLERLAAMPKGNGNEVVWQEDATVPIVTGT